MQLPFSSCPVEIFVCTWCAQYTNAYRRSPSTCFDAISSGHCVHKSPVTFSLYFMGQSASQPASPTSFVLYRFARIVFKLCMFAFSVPCAVKWINDKKGKKQKRERISDRNSLIKLPSMAFICYLFTDIPQTEFVTANRNARVIDRTEQIVGCVSVCANECADELRVMFK